MIRELFEKQRVLMSVGAICVLCFLILAVIAPFDSVQVLGINRWVKPIKFFVSTAIFVWTVALYLSYLKDYRKSDFVISWGMVLIFLVELSAVVLQAARGTTSHFNVKEPFDGILFAVMGMFIISNTILVIYLFLLYLTAKIDLPKSIVWGMRLGLILFLAASFEGGYMSAQMAHSVGVADGGAGLPIINWSSKGGDLRVAHFFGLHAFQAVPFFAYTLEKYKVKSPTVWTFAFALAYLSIFTFLFIQALDGQPLVAGF